MLGSTPSRTRPVTSGSHSGSGQRSQASSGAWTTSERSKLMNTQITFRRQQAAAKVPTTSGSKQAGDPGRSARPSTQEKISSVRAPRSASRQLSSDVLNRLNARFNAAWKNRSAGKLTKPEIIEGGKSSGAAIEASRPATPAVTATDSSPSATSTPELAQAGVPVKHERIFTFAEKHPVVRSGTSTGFGGSPANEDPKDSFGSSSARQPGWQGRSEKGAGLIESNQSEIFQTGGSDFEAATFLVSPKDLSSDPKMPRTGVTVSSDFEAVLASAPALEILSAQPTLLSAESDIDAGNFLVPAVSSAAAPEGETSSSLEKGKEQPKVPLTGSTLVFSSDDDDPSSQQAAEKKEGKEQEGFVFNVSPELLASDDDKHSVPAPEQKSKLAGKLQPQLSGVQLISFASAAESFLAAPKGRKSCDELSKQRSADLDERKGSVGSSSKPRNERLSGNGDKAAQNFSQGVQHLIFSTAPESRVKMITISEAALKGETIHFEFEIVCSSFCWHS